MAEKMDLLKVIAFATKMQNDAQPPELNWRGATTAKHWGRVADAWEKGEPVNWNSFCGSPEIFHAMGIPSIMQEEIGVMSAVFPGKLNEKYIDIAHEHLVADHVCSTQKVMIGAALCGDLPPPTTIVHAGQPCDSTMVTYSALSHHLGVPLLTLDIPGGKNERVVQYVADEIERMVAFLEEHTGKKLEDDKLREVMEYSNIAHDYSLKVNDLMKMVPCPLPRILASTLLDSAGTTEGVEIYKNLYESGRTVVETGKGYVPNQKLRAGLFSTWVA
ncbi:MAG: 2-hydroxyacyl-CoA dehydratase, partial [Dehalococcoidia bacterium]|nr:2-hydroxyacyl-CoA dehydratase [Dehalococcoidia bacterium]